MSSNSSSFFPSAMDLVLVLPRLAKRAGSFALYNVPEAVDNIAGKMFNTGGVIADATGKVMANTTTTNSGGSFMQSTSALPGMVSEAWREGGEEVASTMLTALWDMLIKIKNFGGIFSYLTSRWALATFGAAIILNRTTFYASSRDPLRLRFFVRLALFAIPIMAFLTQTLSVLQAMKCQTSPDFAELRYGDPLKNLTIDFAGEGGFLYNLSSSLLFWQDDAASCAAGHMSHSSINTKSELRGSMSLLFRFFLVICVSQMFEALFCALQGKQPMPETGMTLFEHSLAFAECEAMISSALGFGFFGLKSTSQGSSTESTASDGPFITITRGELLNRINVPPEVLLVCLITCCSHLSSSLLAVIGKRNKVRLVNTGIWSCCYMTAFIWTFQKIITSPMESAVDLGILRFPTVCVVGFIPHMMILVGIIMCTCIYTLAFIVTLLAVPSNIASGLSIRERFAWAYQNLQANVQFSSASSIRIKMSEDFYTTLLKIGFTILTAASEAVYLNEGSRIHVASMTWLEQKRINEFASRIETRKRLEVPSELLDDDIARNMTFEDIQNEAIGPSPYARERKSKPASTTERNELGTADGGLGMNQRRSRMQLTVNFLHSIFWLVVVLQAQMLLSILRKMGIGRRPSWLLKAAGQSRYPRRRTTLPESASLKHLQFWMMDSNGDLTIPLDDNVDVEAEMRRRTEGTDKFDEEETLSDSLYKWWQIGGWFGNLDSSGDYETVDLNDDDDTTSMISMSTNANAADEWSDVEESGRRTPTQHDPFGSRTRETTPESDASLDMSALSRLLNPQSTADREEARLLSYSLQSQRPMTRSQYRRSTDRNRAQLLSGLRSKTSASTDKTKPTEEEDERDLEQFILTSRAKAREKAARAAEHGNAGTWESGAAGMGEGGPLCVVCQTTPRSILLWPCGCLSMCDDCRINLAARNYTKCICCRTDIAAYSRLYVP